MPTTPGKRTAKLRTTLTKRVIDTLQPTDKSWIAWDDKLTGFGVCIRPGGAKSFIVNYRTGDRGRKAPNKRVVIGRYDKTTPEHAECHDSSHRVSRKPPSVTKVAAPTAAP